MTIYIRSTRNGVQGDSLFSGMSEETIIALLAELGHTDITVITEEDYTPAE